jgi:DNA helicase-2/ATP-dependent DNA helicase PcrA
MIELNKQRQDYVDARGKVVLNACPGSGKTTTIAYKLHILIENEYKLVNSEGIACLSFTNVAKDEIKQKYFEFSKKTLSYPHTVATIDSFINTYITLPFYYLSTEKYERPNILDENSILDTFHINGLWDYKSKKHRHLNNEGKPLIFIYKPSSIVKDLNGEYTSNGNLPDLLKVETAVFNDYAKTIKTWQFEKGILTNSDSTVIAYNILNKFPHVTKSLALRFKHIIIDEAQDTSEIQHAIFQKLIDNGLENIEFIGDPYQSLYVWRNAKPKVFMNKYSDPEWQGLDLGDNWRSTKKIIETYSRLRNLTDKTIIARNKSEIEHPIYILTFEKDNEKQALEKYKKLCICYKDNRVVTRGVELSDKLNEISKNPNDYWKNSLGLKIITSVIHMKDNNIKLALDTFRSAVNDILNPKLDYKTKREKLKELKSDYNLNAEFSKLLIEFSDFNTSLTEWTKKTSERLTVLLKLTTPLDFQLKEGTFRPKHKQLMVDLFSNKKMKWSFPISTIHKVKGMTLDTILLFLHKDGHSISLKDITPSNGILTEKQTMIYVAMSRPRHLLAIAIENTVEIKKINEKLGDDIKII